MASPPNQTLSRDVIPDGATVLIPVPAGVSTRRSLPRLFSAVMFLVATIGYATLYPRLESEELNIPSFLDGYLRGGAHRLEVLHAHDQSLLGELTVSVEHEENYNVVVEGSFGAEGKAALSVNAEFSQYRYLQQLSIRVIEPGAALELLWSFQGDRIAHLVVTDSTGPRRSELQLPAPVLLRDIGEDDYAVVSPLSLQRLLADPEHRVAIRELGNDAQSDFSRAQSFSLVQFMSDRLRQLASSSEEKKV